VCVAIADGKLSTPEKRFLRRLGKTLNTNVDLAEIDKMAARLRDGDVQTDEPAALWAPAFA
jgi:hypothetical protein